MFIDDLLTEDMYYIFNPLSLYNENWRWDDKKFAALPKDKLVLVNCASEHYGTEEFTKSLYQKLQEHTDDFLILTSNVAEHLALPKLLFYPYWYHWTVKNWTKEYQVNITVDRKKYLLSCTNRAPRPHRIYNYITMNIRDDMLFTMRQGIATRDDDLILPDDVLQKWNEIKANFKDCEIDVDFPPLKDPAWTDSYIHLVTETTISDKLFITEKTWKPIVSGQLFMILGNPNTIAHLRTVGVDCFDDIIDHDYDIIKDPIERIKMIHTYIDKLLGQDLYLINMMTKQRRRNNAELFCSGNLYSNYDQEIKRKL